MLLSTNICKRNTIVVWAALGIRQINILHHAWKVQFFGAIICDEGKNRKPGFTLCVSSSSFCRNHILIALNCLYMVWSLTYFNCFRDSALLWYLLPSIIREMWDFYLACLTWVFAYHFRRKDASGPGMQTIEGTCSRSWEYVHTTYWCFFVSWRQCHYAVNFLLANDRSANKELYDVLGRTHNTH